MQSENPNRIDPSGVCTGPAHRPVIGIPWRTTGEEQVRERRKLDYYFKAVQKAGAQPKEISLTQDKTLLEQAVRECDGFILPGSPVDVDPAAYGAIRHSKTNKLDLNRERTDNAILEHALAAAN